VEPLLGAGPASPALAPRTGSPPFCPPARHDPMAAVVTQNGLTWKCSGLGDDRAQAMKPAGCGGGPCGRWPRPAGLPWRDAGPFMWASRIASEGISRNCTPAGGSPSCRQAGRQDGPALQDTAAALGSQAQHLVLAGAERGLYSRSGPAQDTAQHWSLRHPAWVTSLASDGNFTIRAAISRRAPGLYIWASARRWRLRESLG
jgi:hypothetical protein